MINFNTEYYGNNCHFYIKDRGDKISLYYNVANTLTESKKSEDKIEYSLDQEILKIKDLYLEENEVITLCELFEKNDVFPYMDKEDEDDFYGGYDDFDDSEEDNDEY